MKRAREAVLVLSLAVSALAAACAGSASSSSSDGSAGHGGSTGNGGSTGAGGAGGEVMCTVAVVPISPASFDGLVPGPSATLRVQGQPHGPLPSSYRWGWRVTTADGSNVPLVVPMLSDPSLIQFPLATPGSYTINVELDSSSSTPCLGVRTVTAAQPGAQLATFRFRITPPAGATVPAQELERQVIGGTPTGGNLLALQPGIQVPLDVRRSGSSAPLPAYVRLTDTASGTVVEARTGAGGPASVRVAGGTTYTMLIVPDGTAVAPALFDATAAAALPAGTIMLDDGIAVGGTVRDASGNPFAGATVVLRAGALVSTVARSDAGGAFHAQVRPGTFGVTLSAPLPPAATLEADLAASAGGVVIASGTTPPQLALKLGASATASAHATVALQASDPASLGPGARVTLEEAAPLAGAASLDLGGGGPALSMPARVRAELGPATSGGAVTVDLGTLPPAPYRLTVYPADGSTNDAVTVAPLDLSGGSVASAPVALAAKVAVRGKLLPPSLLSPDLVAGVEMLATDTQGLPIVGSQAAAADGTFAILVSPLRTYALQALPAPGQPLARALFPTVTVANADVDVPDQDMPPGLFFAGTVVDSAPAPVASARVQVFCVAGASGCADATVPLAETVTRSDGSFQLVLPDPGTGGN
jgi:hypothetical protein